MVQDHYSITSDKQCPTFLLRDVGRGSGREGWSSSNQLDQLFVHKMSDVLRVLLTIRLLATGPDVEKGFTYNEVGVCVCVSVCVCLCFLFIYMF